MTVFWQGAASGALGSIGGTISGGFGLTDFWSTTAISSVSGGIGAYIGGARTAEDILFGMATGAIVGALNHGPHNDEEVDPSKLKITYEEGSVQIDNRDEYTVRAALKYPRQVAAIAKKIYFQKYGEKLKISTSSLENEIMYHALAYKMGVMKDNAKISNCGDSSVDGNRWFWDFFSGMN